LANKTRMWRPRVKNQEYLLTGLITCAKCNHRYTGVSSISNHRLNIKKRWYRCSGPYANHIRCTNRSVKAEDIEPEVTKIVAQLVQNERLKQSRWTTGTEIASAPSGPRNDGGGTAARNDGGLLKNKLKINQEKQSKLMDAYLENLLGEDVYRAKITELRNGKETAMSKESKGYKNMPKKACPERLVVSEAEPSRRVYIRTFGCQMNEHDSGRVKDLLTTRDFCFTEEPGEADILLFNTCSVRKRAEDRVVGRIASLKALKERRPDVIFGILGCMAEALREDLFIKLPHVDFLCGPADLDRIPEIIKRVKSGARRLIYLDGHKAKKIPEFPEDRGVAKNAYVKIMEGCDNFCSYCVVPYVRGRERSRPLEEILKEIDSLVHKGVQRITLLGQNVNSYGKGLKQGVSFAGLLKKIDDSARGKAEVNFFTSHPKDASTQLFKVIAGCRSVSKSLHLPLQSGSNKILKKMNRGYTVEKYKKLIKDFRKIAKGADLTTDIIVGFPGETKKDFNDTLKAVKEIKFSGAYIFKYSPRPFTEAGKLKDSVPKEEKETRHAALLSAQKEICRKKK